MAVTYVAVSKLGEPTTDGVLVEVKGNNDTKNARKAALEKAVSLWEEGRISRDAFPDGLTDANLVHVPRTPSTTPELDIVEGARQLLELSQALLVESEARVKAEPYRELVATVLVGERPLTNEECEKVKDKSYGKTIEAFAIACAHHQKTRRDSDFEKIGLVLNALDFVGSEDAQSQLAPREKKKLDN